MLKLRCNMLDSTISWKARLGAARGIRQRFLALLRTPVLAMVFACAPIIEDAAAAGAASAPPPAASTAEGATPIGAAPGRRARHAMPLPRPSDLDAVLAQAAAHGEVVVALAMRPDCPFCAALVRDQLIHLHRGEKAAGVQVIAVDQASREPLRVGGRTMAPAAWLAALDVRAVPTVLFLGPRGELAERLVGYASPDFYNAYLEARTEQARARLQETRKAR